MLVLAFTFYFMCVIMFSYFKYKNLGWLLLILLVSLCPPAFVMLIFIWIMGDSPFDAKYNDPNNNVLIGVVNVLFYVVCMVFVYFGGPWLLACFLPMFAVMFNTFFVFLFLIFSGMYFVASSSSPPSPTFT
jgi:hypothetical protein